MSEFGIYWGTEVINITDVKGKKVLMNVSFPKPAIIGSVSEQEQEGEGEGEDIAKIASALKEEFIKNDISLDNAYIALAGENLIIRTFDLPIFLSRKELEYPAIAFEARKYIPFKTEDVLFDFRIFLDRKAKKYLILFVGIKKELLNRYLAIFEQLQIKVRLVEYAGFSILRLLSLGGLSNKGVFGVLSVDLEDETNFLVCQDGFPLFSRDIILTSKLEAEEKTDFIGRLKSEIRISLDFFRRKFINKKINRIVILSPPQIEEEIVTLVKELGLSPMPLKTSKFLENDFEFTGVLSKSYSTAVSKVKKLRYSIDLLKPAVKKEKKWAPSLKALPLAIGDIKLSSKVVLLSCLMIVVSVGASWIKRVPRENELRVLKANQPKVEAIIAGNSYQALLSLEKEYNKKIKDMNSLVKGRFYLTEALDMIPRLMPAGTWLNMLDFKITGGKLEFKLEGIVSLSDPDKEFAAINDLVLGLNNNPKFNQHFNDINVVSMARANLGRLKLEATKFTILCR